MRDIEMWLFRKVGRENCMVNKCPERTREIYVFLNGSSLNLETQPFTHNTIKTKRHVFVGWIGLLNIVIIVRAISRSHQSTTVSIGVLVVIYTDITRSFQINVAKEAFNPCTAWIISYWQIHHHPSLFVSRRDCRQSEGAFSAANTFRPRQNSRDFQTTFSNAFSLMKMYRFQLRFHWSLF